MKIFLLLKLLCYSHSWADESQPTSEWFICEKDTECVEINYTCAGAVVNKNFTTAATTYYAYKNSISNCVQTKPSAELKKIPYKVQCEKKKCSSQGVNPKAPGFS